jgi:formylmethanofuran dehydrogenase subunit A
LKIVKGYGIKIVNPCGSEAWGWGMNVHGIDDPAPYWDVTGREMVRALSQANEMLGLPHSIHVHPNDLGHPGNFPTTVGTMDCVKDVEKNKFFVRNQTYTSLMPSSTLWAEPVGERC